MMITAEIARAKTMLQKMVILILLQKIFTLIANMKLYLQFLLKLVFM